MKKITLREKLQSTEVPDGPLVFMGPFWQFYFDKSLQGRRRRGVTSHDPRTFENREGRSSQKFGYFSIFFLKRI